jgi:hypothetical protein
MLKVYDYNAPNQDKCVYGCMYVQGLTVDHVGLMGLS